MDLKSNMSIVNRTENGKYSQSVYQNTRWHHERSDPFTKVSSSSEGKIMSARAISVKAVASSLNSFKCVKVMKNIPTRHTY